MFNNEKKELIESTRIKKLDKYAIITNKEYKDALTMNKNDNAYLVMLRKGIDYKIDTNRIYINNLAASSTVLHEVSTYKGMEDINFVLLRGIYSLILGFTEEKVKAGKAIQSIYTISIPDLLRYFGKNKWGKNEINSLNNSFYNLQSLVGIINGDILPVFYITDKDKHNKTISFSCPYLCRVIKEVHKASSIRRKKTNSMNNNSLLYEKKASHSYLIKPSIYNERNKKAIETVHIIVTLIERSGKYKPHIRAKTIVDNNPLLIHSMNNSNTSNKNIMLQRTFVKSWELLRNQTLLNETYGDIQLPDPKDKKKIPTTSTLDMVYEFPNAGKNKGI